MKIDRRAWPGGLMGCVAIGFLWFVWREGVWLGFLLLMGHLAFFRDPHRKPPLGKDAVSPADGKVVEVTEEFEGRFLKEDAIKIGIFLSVFVPHVNRAPVTGKIGYLKYEPGKFLNALSQDSVKINEANWIGVEGNEGRALVKQVSGAIARRIHGDVELGQMVERAGKIGIICYGSRAECYLPKRLFRIAVAPGQKVKAGQSILGFYQP